MHRALAEPVRAYALIAEPVDPAVEAERLTFRRAYADLFARALRATCRGELRRPTPSSPRPRSSARSPRRSSGRSPAATPTRTSSPPALTAFVLSAVGASPCC